MSLKFSKYIGDDGDGICQQNECAIYYDLGYDKKDNNQESGCFDEDNEYGKILIVNLTYIES